MDKNFEEFSEFWTSLVDDILEAMKDLKETDSQYHRRNLLRTFVSTIEGASFYLRKFSLESPEVFDSGEISLLKEESYFLNNKGQVSITTKFLPTPEGFKFSLQMFLKGNHPDFNIDTNSAGWKLLNETMKIRNRITHPKGKKELIISDVEIKKIRKASTYFLSVFTKNLIESIKYLKSKIEKLKIESEKNRKILKKIRD